MVIKVITSCDTILIGISKTRSKPLLDIKTNGSITPRSLRETINEENRD